MTIMQRILAATLLSPFFAYGATTTPVQLLNPAGSTAGQAIVSTGPSSAPGWASISSGTLAPIAANTVLGNFTGSSAAPAAFSVASCSTANSALKYTSGTGLSCGTTFALTSGNLSQFAATTSAQLAGVISDETGTGVLVLGTTPTLNQPNIVGTTTNNNAATGSVGEYVTATSGAVAITSNTPANGISISLTAGDWDVDGSVFFLATASLSSIAGGVSVASTTFPAIPLYFGLNANLIANNGQSFGVPTTRISLTTTTTVYVVVQGVFASGTCNVTSFIRARRVR
jgi:hypothetical protein